MERIKRSLAVILGVGLLAIPGWYLLDILGLAKVRKSLICSLIVLTPFALCLLVAFHCGRCALSGSVAPPLDDATPDRLLRPNHKAK